MSDPITKEERKICQRFVDHCAPTIAPKASYDWLRGYEALALDLEQKIENKSLKILALTEEMMIAEEALSQTGAMAMAKVNK